MATGTIGSYKGTPISAGTDAQVAAQVSAVNSKSTASTNLSNSGLSGGTMSAAQQSLSKIYDTPIGVGGKIDTNTGQVLSGPMAGQKAGTDQGSAYTGPAALPQLPQPKTPTPLAPGAADAAATANVPAQTTAAGNLASANLSSSTATGVASDTVNPFQAAHAALTASGAEAPNSATAARTQTSGVMPGAGPNTAMVDAAMKTPELTALTKLATDYFSPDNQKASLLEQYNQMYKESGLSGLDDKILNASNVINGTEDDIRSEIQKSGGFGTDSQVQAMAQSRNKVLLQNYNTLVQQKATAEAHLNTMVGLAGQDRAYAQQQFTNQLSVLGQMATFRQQATNNVKEAFNNIVAKVGYGGAYQAYKGDPQQMAMVEQLNGIAPGGLQKLSTYVAPLTASEKLDNQYKQAEINNINSQISQRNNPLGALLNTPGGATQVLQPYMQTAYDGTQYADLSSLTPTDKTKYAQIAEASGIKPILDSGTAGKLNAISVSKTNLQNIGDAFTAIPTEKKGIPAAQGISNSIKSFFGDPQIKSFQAYRTAVINNVQALAGGQGSGLRITKAEIDAALQNDLPIVTGIHADTPESGAAKIAKLNSQLDVWNQQILHGGNTPATNPSGGTTVMTGPGGTYNVPNDKVDVFKSNGYK